MKRYPKSVFWTATIPLAAAMMIAGGSLAAETAAPTTDARAILMRMATFLGSQDRFQVEISCGYDSLQESGKKIEFLELRNVLVDRPARLRAEVEQSDGDRSLLLIDGKTVTAHGLTQNVYAQTEAKATLDESIIHFVSDLKMRFPLAMLMVQRLPDELTKRLTSIEYVEPTTILGTPTHHLVGSTDTVDFQIWVDAGEKPLPRRIVMTYRNEEGQPQYRAQFGEWDLSPATKDSAFEFEAPAKATKIAFVTQLQATALATTGDRK